MEYKIGQIFEIDGIWYQFVKDDANGCKNCVFYYYSKIKCAIPDEDVRCSKWHREDGNNGHFVRLLPLGDVYEQGGERWQQYKCVEKPNTEDKRVYISNADSEVGLLVSIKLSSSNMERKIGEIFEYNGEWYQCVMGHSCLRCDLHKPNLSASQCDYNSHCFASKRKDKTSVVFKKLEKVGEPCTMHDHSRDKDVVIQDYELYNQHACYNGHEETLYFGLCGRGWNSNNKSKESIISLEIKQNKEDMEEKKASLPKEDNPLTRVVYAYVNGKISDKELIRSIKEMSDEYPYNKNNLKPFSLELAKQGKPVCTRDGRKARIICFDRNDLYPIVALIESEDGKEMIGAYSNEGKTEIYEIKGTDLMMLPEKKEGWVNVFKRDDGSYHAGEIYNSDDSAARMASEKNYITTIKIFWEE